MSILRATRYVASVELIDVEELRDEGVRCVLLDRDNTVVPRDMKNPPEKVLKWIDALHEVGISTCVISNNFHTEAVCRSARELGSGVVHHAMKPLPAAVRLALKTMGVKPSEAIMVGDQVLTDVIAGNLGGVRTILVRPQSQEDLFYTKAFRRIESVILRDTYFEGE